MMTSSSGGPVEPAGRLHAADSPGTGSDGASGAQADCLVIGAGMAGLTAAQVMTTAGLKVAVLDKARGVGGRMSTRRMGDGAADHGAQLLVAWGSAFRGQLHGWRANGWLTSWPIMQSVPDFPAPIDQLASIPLRATGGMNKLPKHLAERLDLRLEARIESIARDGDGWRVRSEKGYEYTGRALLLTPPVPQSLELLAASADAIGTTDMALLARLRSVEYERCLTLIAKLATPSRISFPGLWLNRKRDSPVRLVVDHLLKGTSERDPIVTLHSTHQYAVANWDGDKEAIAHEMFAAANDAIEAPMIEWQVHRWRYSRPQRMPLSAPAEGGAKAESARDLPDFGVLTDAPPLAMAGDGFGGHLIETAWESGRAAGVWLRDRLQ